MTARASRARSSSRPRASSWSSRHSVTLVAPTPGGPQRADDVQHARDGRFGDAQLGGDLRARPIQQAVLVEAVDQALGDRARRPRWSPAGPRAAERACPARPPPCRRRRRGGRARAAAAPAAEHTGQRVRHVPRQSGHSPASRRSSAGFVHSSRSTTDCMAAHGRISISLNATRAGDTSRPTLGAMAISSANDNAGTSWGDV